MSGIYRAPPLIATIVGALLLSGAADSKGAAAACAPGSKAAVIARKQVCLKPGIRCGRRLDAQYHRYGFHCHSGRLTPTPKSPNPPSLPPGVLAAINLGGEEGWALDAGEGALWAQVGDVGVVRIDPATNRITARIGEVRNVEFVGDELWGVVSNRLLQLDPATGRTTATIPIPETDAFRVLGGDGALWVPTGRKVLRVERSGAVTTTPIDCPGAREAAFGFGSLWLACKDGDLVLRFDVSTRRVVSTIRTGSGPHHVAIGDDAVWVANYRADTVARIDPSSNSIVATIRGAGSGVGLTIGNGLLWAAQPNGVAKIDPRTNRVVGRVALPNARMYYGLVVFDDSLWACGRAPGIVYRVRI